MSAKNILRKMFAILTCCGTFTWCAFAPPADTPTQKKSSNKNKKSAYHAVSAAFQQSALGKSQVAIYTKNEDGPRSDPIYKTLGEILQQHHKASVPLDPYAYYVVILTSQHCPPCKMLKKLLIPALGKMSPWKKGNKVMVIFLASESQETHISSAHPYAILTAPVPTNKEEATSSIFKVLDDTSMGVGAVPTAYVFDREGKFLQGASGLDTSLQTSPTDGPLDVLRLLQLYSEKAAATTPEFYKKKGGVRFYALRLLRDAEKKSS